MYYSNSKLATVLLMYSINLPKKSSSLKAFNILPCSFYTLQIGKSTTFNALASVLYKIFIYTESIKCTIKQLEKMHLKKFNNVLIATSEIYKWLYRYVLCFFLFVILLFFISFSLYYYFAHKLILHKTRPKYLFLHTHMVLSVALEQLKKILSYSNDLYLFVVTCIFSTFLSLK